MSKLRKLFISGFGEDAVAILTALFLLVFFALLLNGCIHINYKTTNIDAQADRDVSVDGRTENLTEAADIAPQVKAQVAEKMQGADQVKMGGANK